MHWRMEVEKTVESGPAIYTEEKSGEYLVIGLFFIPVFPPHPSPAAEGVL